MHLKKQPNTKRMKNRWFNSPATVFCRLCLWLDVLNKERKFSKPGNDDVHAPAKERVNDQ
jgi:hypothetical protein